MENNGYYYILKHYGPGTIPKDVNIIEQIDIPNKCLIGVVLNRFLTTKELNYYDIYPETHPIYDDYPYEEVKKNAENIRGNIINGVTKCQGNYISK